MVFAEDVSAGSSSERKNVFKSESEIKCFVRKKSETLSSVQLMMRFVLEQWEQENQQKNIYNIQYIYILYYYIIYYYITYLLLLIIILYIII